MSNSQTTEQISLILGIILAVMVVILVVLLVTYFLIKMKTQKKKSKIVEQEQNESGSGKTTKGLTKSAKEYTRAPISDFMEFDKIEDNMIIQKDGSRYLMVIQCQGINYDLMSGMEKTAVENGFIEFLNTIRHPIQIYIQTRTVNLEDSISSYQKRLTDIEDKLIKMKMQYQQMVNAKTYSQEEVNKLFYEITKQTNLYEYGRDIIHNTEAMSLNKSVLSKQYYIIIPYYSAENTTGNFDKDEVKNMAFSELYTKAQSIVRTLSACSVNGKILESNELIELLYIAYNRDEAENFGLEKALRAGYDELYSTAPDVLDKRMKELDMEIERRAFALANEKITEVKSEKQKKVEKKENKLSDLIKDMAKLILQENEQYIGKEVVEESIQKIEKEDLTKGGEEDVGEQKKKRGRKPKQTV